MPQTKQRKEIPWHSNPNTRNASVAAKAAVHTATQRGNASSQTEGLRLLKAQGVLFADGSDRKFYAVLTNLEWDGARLLSWHREKAGTIEHAHDEIKNALGGAHMPSQKLAVNAAWFTIALLAYNTASAIKSLCFEGEERTARLKRYRLLVIEIAGRIA